MCSSDLRKHPTWGGWVLLHRVSISRRRGGRPCPPAGNVRFYGNPMRNRNILKGRCGHRPLRTTTRNQRILRADRVVRPYKGYEKPRASGEKAPRFPFRAVGVDAHLGAKSRALRGCASKLACGRRIDPQETPVLWWFSGESVLVFYFAP